jgi:hypothetical protein
MTSTWKSASERQKMTKIYGNRNEYETGTIVCVMQVVDSDDC